MIIFAVVGFNLITCSMDLFGDLPPASDAVTNSEIIALGKSVINIF